MQAQIKSRNAANAPPAKLTRVLMLMGSETGKLDEFIHVIHILSVARKQIQSKACVCFAISN